MSAGHHHLDDLDDRRDARRIALTLALVAGYLVAEVVGGLWSGSLALLADAGHMFADAGALALALVATRIARRPPSPTHTFGYRRAEILAALANGAALVAIAALIGYHAVTRLGAAPRVHGPIMLAVAAGGLAVNLAGLWILRSGRSRSLNVRGAWLHVLADALGSVGAMASGALVTGLGWHWADPVASLAIAALVVWSAWLLLRRATAVLMQAVPEGVEVAAVERALTTVTGVSDAHDLHIWSVTGDRAVLSAHLTLAPDADRRRVVAEVHRRLRERFDLRHSTIQLDCPEPCQPCAGQTAAAPR